MEFSCPQLAGPEELDLPAPTDDRLVLTADQAELTQEGLSTLAGTVRLVKGGSRLEAQALSFDRQTQQVKLSAESLFRNRDLIVRSKQAELDLANETGTFHGAEFTLVNRASRGAAETVTLTKDGTVDVTDVYYTTCPPGSRAWFLEASEIELDREAGLGRAKHARLRFGYVPILYMPWFQFPIDDRRRTGVLFPTIGDSDTTGFDARLPVYLNLAPNYDAQITPRYMSDRGTMIGTEGRYLFHRNTGHLSYEHLDEDKVEREKRSWFDFSHQGLINRRLAAEVKYGEASDTRYFEDFSTSLQAASINYLERSAQLTYTAPAAYSVMARVTDFQPASATALLDPLTNLPNPDLEPYQRLPEIRLDAQTGTARFGTRLGLSAQYVNFVRDTPPEGQRLDVDPYVRFFVDRSAWYAASQLDYRHTRYSVTDPNTTLTRTLPQFSIEGGLRFERLTDDGELQTLEPRLYYLNVPFREQSGLPQFDSGEPDFDFVQLFERNRYSGMDRISDANHLALSLTSRLLDPADGAQRLSASIGQIYRFEETQVALQGCTVNCTADRGGTDFIGEVDYRLPAGFRFTTAGQWSQDRNEIIRGGIGLRYRSERRRADLSYRFREVLPLTGTELEQVDLSAATPLVGSLSLLGRWRYSRGDYRTLEALGGLQYETCCWSLRTAYRRYQFNTDQEYTTGIYLQLELKGLTRIGAGFESL
ncbi:MAG: LPS-assembly protein LptD, partial [Nevskiaceae bacterium]